LKFVVKVDGARNSLCQIKLHAAGLEKEKVHSVNLEPRHGEAHRVRDTDTADWMERVTLTVHGGSTISVR